MKDVRGPARGVGGSVGEIGVLLPSGWVLWSRCGKWGVIPTPTAAPADSAAPRGRPGRRKRTLHVAIDLNHFREDLWKIKSL